MKLRISCQICLMVAWFPSLVVSQAYFECFEESAVGDTVDSVGVVGPFGSYLIDNVGVDGSKGFEVPVASNPFSFQNGILPVDFGVMEIGQKLSFSANAQLVLTGGQTPIPYAVLFDVGIFGSGGNFLLGMFGVEDDDNTFTTRIFVTGDNVDDVNEVNPDTVEISEIGIEEGLTGESTFVKLQMDIVKIDTFSYVISNSIFDVNDNLFTRSSVSGIDIAAIFEDMAFAAVTTSKHSFFESARFDNFSYCTQMVMPADVNLDGEVNLLDVAPFVDLLSTGDYQSEADVNLDGAVDLIDVATFVELLTGA